MIAFKTFEQCPDSQRPSGVPVQWPWQEMDCSDQMVESLQLAGFTVLSEEAYASYKAQYQTAFDTWLASNQVAAIKASIAAKIYQYQQLAPKICRELYAENTYNGISTAQSDQMFDDYEDVLIRLREGAFPTALRRLQFKRPSGFVTQALIDAWRDKIISYL